MEVEACITTEKIPCYRSNVEMVYGFIETEIEISISLCWLISHCDSPFWCILFAFALSFTFLLFHAVIHDKSVGWSVCLPTPNLEIEKFPVFIVLTLDLIKWYVSNIR